MALESVCANGRNTSGEKPTFIMVRRVTVDGKMQNGKPLITRVEYTIVRKGQEVQMSGTYYDFDGTCEDNGISRGAQHHMLRGTAKRPGRGGKIVSIAPPEYINEEGQKIANPFTGVAPTVVATAS